MCRLEIHVFRQRFASDLCRHVHFFSVQLQEILKEKWSIDDELVPPIDKHEDAQRGNDHQNNQTWTSK